MGTAQQGDEQRGSSTTHAATQVASLQGSVALSADGRYTQTGSTLAAPEGDIGIRARAVQMTQRTTAASPRSAARPAAVRWAAPSASR